MDKKNDPTPITPESVLATLKEMIAIERAEAERRAAETERRAAEYDRKAAKKQAEYKREVAEINRQTAKYKRQSAKMEEEYKRQSAEYKRQSAEYERQSAEYARQDAERKVEAEKDRKALQESIRQVNQQLGGMGNSNGDFAEDFFYNAFLNGKRNIFGEEFDDVMRRNKVTINRGFEDEYDIVLVNGRAVCVIEVKYQADSADLSKKVLRKAETFRVNFPLHNDKKVYLALASLSFNPLTEQACKDSGIAIIKQDGNAIAIFDERLRTF